MAEMVHLPITWPAPIPRRMFLPRKSISDFYCILDILKLLFHFLEISSSDMMVNITDVMCTPHVSVPRINFSIEIPLSLTTY